MKRIFDTILAVLILITLSPILLVVSLLIIIVQGRPVFFKQARLGRAHQEFSILKFCTMTSQRDVHGELLPDNERTTSLGDFLRRTSFDEFPGFWNVVMGEMSIVGPRPLPPQYRERYSTEQDRRHEVKPGVTGWAQINGRNSISWEDKFLLDVWYVKNQSLFLDVRIILLTVNYVLSRKGIVPDDKGAMEEFMGTKDRE